MCDVIECYLEVVCVRHGGNIYIYLRGDEERVTLDRGGCVTFGGLSGIDEADSAAFGGNRSRSGSSRKLAAIVDR